MSALVLHGEVSDHVEMAIHSQMPEVLRWCVGSLVDQTHQTIGGNTGGAGAPRVTDVVAAAAV